MKQSLLIRGARVVDPASDRDEIADILILEGRVSRVEKNLREEGVPTLDAKGLIACPGFIDMHVHLREPGQEYKETILSGTRAAVAGGFTAVACMANTNPPNDSVPITQAIVQIAAEQGACRVWPIAAVTKGMEGHELTEFGELKKAGAIALSDDGKPITDAALMRRALEYAGMFDLLIIDHAEEPTLSAGGQMHEGWTSTKLGLRGIPSASEDIHVARDMMLAELTGSAIHIAHLSTAMSLDLVRHGKRRGLRVSCEVAPHHFLLSDEAVEGYDTSAKMKPPLRTEADIKALLKGLHDGTIDCIATDHAPHHADEKDCPFDQAAFGIVGLETAVSLALHHLLRTDVVTLARLVALMSWNPARILGIPGGTLSSGAPGDVTLLDLGRKVVIDAQRFETKGRATPWHGVELIGGAAATVVGGRVAWTAEGGVTSR